MLRHVKESSQSKGSLVSMESYRNDPKFSDRQVRANSADPDQSDQGLNCLLFEPRCEKTGFLHMRKQRRRSASR